MAVVRVRHLLDVVYIDTFAMCFFVLCDNIEKNATEKSLVANQTDNGFKWRVFPFP